MDYRKAVEHLREKAEIFKKSNYAVDGVVKCFEESADTIEQLTEELKQFKDKQEQGMLIELPCKVGDTIYLVDFEEKEYDEATVWSIEIDSKDNRILINSDYEVGTYAFDSYVFYSKAEAESALAKMGGKQ